MTFKEILDLAIRKGYNHWDGLTDHELSPERKYLELCFIQKWLREKHKIHINIYPTDNDEGAKQVKWMYSYISRFDNSIDEDAFGCMDDTEYDTFEDALLEAIDATVDII